MVEIKQYRIKLFNIMESDKIYDSYSEANEVAVYYRGLFESNDIEVVEVNQGGTSK